MTTQALKRRFDELLAQLEEIEKTKAGEVSDPEYVDGLMLLGWQVKARNLLSRACGAESEYYKQFQASENNARFKNTYSFMLTLRAVFAAAKEDYEGGYLRTIRSLVHAELFDDELEQARELQASGFKAAAAVVAGVVLETTLRKLCGDMGIPVAKLDRMNADLAKAGLYDKLVQKRVTVLADIRNKAAHGDTVGFNDDDVNGMITDIERFVSDYPYSLSAKAHGPAHPPSTATDPKPGNFPAYPPIPPSAAPIRRGALRRCLHLHRPGSTAPAAGLTRCSTALRAARPSGWSARKPSNVGPTPRRREPTRNAAAKFRRVMTRHTEALAF